MLAKGRFYANGIWSLIIDSEQQLVDCSTTSFGCNGGYYDKAWMYVGYNVSGQATSASYPYTATQQTCKYPGTTIKGASISSTSPVTYISSGSSTAMMNVLNNKRLVAVTIAVVNSFFNYK